MESNGSFASECRPAASEAFPELNGRSVLLILGRIDPIKNQKWLIAEASELARRHRESFWCLSGRSLTVNMPPR